MKSSLSKFFFTAVAIALSGTTQAASLKNAGILGNSGEQGASLVHFGEKPAAGMGAIYDKYGSLWDRGGVGVFNRYSPDGRQLATYAIPNVSGGRGGSDRSVLFDDTLLLKLDRKLYTFSVEDPAGQEASPLDLEATRVSFGVHDGWAVAAKDREIFLIKPSADTHKIADLNEDVQDVAMGPDGGVFVVTGGKLKRVDEAAPENARGPWPSPGDCPVWLNGFWFGFNWHGTIRRFNAELNPDPGVVLGGASGSFIGYVEGNHELDNGRGLTHLEGNLFAASGITGILHLLEWNPADKRFKIIRRIGAIPSCNGLALDSVGRVWYYTGTWAWSDGPDAPIKDSVPSADGYGIFGATVMEGDVMVAPAIRWGSPAIYAGKLSEPVRAHTDVKGLPKDGAISAVIRVNKKLAVLVANKAGKGSTIYIGNDGKPQEKAGDVELITATPVKEWTSLLANGDNLIGTADGQIIELAPDGDNWRESRRWNSWGSTPDAKFGEKIFAALHKGRLWISDTDRQRVICFDLATTKVIASFGALDKSGNDLATLNAPQTLAANGNRAVVFDSANQRLVKLELTP